MLNFRSYTTGAYPSVVLSSVFVQYETLLKKKKKEKKNASLQDLTVMIYELSFPTSGGNKKTRRGKY